jgi:hypothetical protein
VLLAQTDLGRVLPALHCISEILERRYRGIGTGTHVDKIRL